MAKKQKKPSNPSKVYALYQGGRAKAKSCPKCGAGVFMAKHKGRESCGKCGYTEFNK